AGMARTTRRAVMKTTRVVSALLAALLLAGPLVSLASAQQPAEADSPVGQAAPPAGPVPAAQPPAADLFQETLRAEQATSRNRGLYDVGAVIVNLVLVPGRAITCVLGGSPAAGRLRSPGRVRRERPRRRARTPPGRGRSRHGADGNHGHPRGAGAIRRTRPQAGRPRAARRASARRRPRAAVDAKVID